MNWLRLKQAELACREGRLDEAAVLLGDAGVRDHRRGQTLLNELALKLIKRGQAHLDADRLDEASSDCKKAWRLAGNLAEVAALRTQLLDIEQSKAARQAEHAATAERQQRRWRDAMQQAERDMGAGRLSLGRHVLEPFGDQSVAATMMGKIDHMRHTADHIASRLVGSLDAGDLIDALQHWRSLRETHESRAELPALRRRLREQCIDAVRSAFTRGQLSKAASLASQAADCCEGNDEMTTLTDCIHACQQAATLLATGKLGEAEIALRRAARQSPDAAWLTEAAAQAADAAAASASLAAGPLGDLSHAADTTNAAHTMLPVPENNSPRPASLASIPQSVDAAAAALPSTFILRIDGAAALVCLKPTITVGPISARETSDIALMTDPLQPIATIRREDEDYFLALGADQTPTLLQPGKVAPLSPRCRMTFDRPHAASATARLRFSGARLPQGDVAQVILLDRDLIVGPGASAHLRLNTLSQPIVFVLRDGRLTCRSVVEAHTRSGSFDPAQGLPIDQPMQLGDMHLVIERT